MPEPAVAVRRTVSDALALASSVLRSGSLETPRLDAELLLGHAMGVTRERIVLDVDREVDDETFARLTRLMARRVAREPVAYLVGHKAFRHIEVAVDRRVLIPRPETELLVEVGLTLPSGASVVDVGTGSGAVALALKSERPDLDLWATDVDCDALVVARENARRLGVGVQFVHADLLEGLDRRFDAVLANLPYVVSDFELPPDVVLYEPLSALFAGADGLDVIRRLLCDVADMPLVALEVGFDQASAVRTLMEQAGFASTEVLRDLAGHERVVLARR